MQASLFHAQGDCQGGGTDDAQLLRVHGMVGRTAAAAFHCRHAAVSVAVTDTPSSERLPLPSIIRSSRTGNKAAGSGVRELGQRPTRHTLMPWLYCRAALLSLLGLFAVAMSIAGARAEVPYSVEITGVDDHQLEQDLEAVSQLVKLKDRPPASEAMLRRRAEDDLPRLKQVVEAAGYRAAAVDYAIDQSTDPIKVTVKVVPGPLYHLDKVVLQTPDGATPPDIDVNDPGAFGLEIGGPARSAPVLAPEAEIADGFPPPRRPVAQMTKPPGGRDPGTRTMSVTYTVDPGPTANFGPVAIEGLTSIDRGYVERRIEWQRGAPFDSRAVEETRKALVDSGLFNTARIVNGNEIDGAGEVPMTIHLTERPPHSIGGGIAYNTGEGFGAKAFWEDRNLFGGAGKLGPGAEFAQE